MSLTQPQGDIPEPGGDYPVTQQVLPTMPHAWHSAHLSSLNPPAPYEASLTTVTL